MSDSDVGAFDIRSELERSGALRKGHFRLSSGLHSDTYFQCALLLEDPRVAVEVGRSIAGGVESPVDLVLCPAVGAIVVGFTVALALDRGMVFAERVDGLMRLRRGFHVPAGARVLVVEDVITTGGSILEVADMAERAGATVAALACVVDRGFKSAGSPLVSLARLPTASYEPEECPMCGDGLPLDAPGSRHI